MTKKEPIQAIKSVAKAVAILKALQEAPRPMRVIDLSKTLKLAPSVISRLVQTLSVSDLVEYEAHTGRIHIGLGMAVLGNAAFGRREIDRAAMPALFEIQAKLLSTAFYVSLSTLYDGQAIFLRAHTPLMLQRGVNSVSISPLHATATGKLMAGWLDEAEIRRVLELRGMDPYTNSTVTDPEAFIRQARQARKFGHAVDDEELIEHVRHVAVPVFDHDGNVARSFSVGGPVDEFSADEMDRIVQILQQAALRTSREVGFTGDYPHARGKVRTASA